METTRYSIDTYGRIYRSSGATTGWKGRISGLTVENVLSHIHNKQEEGESLVITRKVDGKKVGEQDFIAGMR